MTTIESAFAALQSLGFSEYETRAYAALVQHEDLNGYEIAKASGIPRANVYAVIDKLVQRGVVHRLECTKGSRYSALDPAQMLRSLQAAHQRALEEAGQALEALAQRREPTAVFNLRDDELLPQARQLIDSAETSLLVAVQPTEARALAASLQQAWERDVAITTLCLEGCDQECGGCQGEIHRYNLGPSDGQSWLMLVVDGRTAYAGYLGGESASALLTEQPVVVELTSTYIRQGATLGLLGSELADKYEGLVSPEVQEQLNRLDTLRGFFGIKNDPDHAPS